MVKAWDDMKVIFLVHVGRPTLICQKCKVIWGAFGRHSGSPVRVLQKAPHRSLG